MWNGHHPEVSGAPTGDRAWQPYTAVMHDPPVPSPLRAHQPALPRASKPANSGNANLPRQINSHKPVLGQWHNQSSSDVGMQAFSTGLCATPSPRIGSQGFAPKPAPAADGSFSSFPVVRPSSPDMPSSGIRGSLLDSSAHCRGQPAGRIGFAASPASPHELTKGLRTTISTRQTVLRPRARRGGGVPASRSSWSPLRRCSGESMPNQFSEGTGAMRVAYVSPMSSQSPVGRGRVIARSSGSRRDWGKAPTKRSEGKDAGWLLPKSPRMQSPSSRRYELAAVAALVTPMVVPVPRLIPSPTNKVSSEQASRAIDSSCVCFPPSPVSRVHPHTVCRDRSSEETGAEPARSGAAHGHAFAWKEPAGQGGSPHFTVPVCPHPAASTADTRGEYAAGKLAERSVVSTFEHCELRAANGSASSAAPTSPMAVLHATGEYAPACTSATWSQCAARGPGPLPASTNNRLQETLGKNQETDPSVARVPRSACPDPALEQADAQYTTRLLVEGKVPHPLAGDQNCSIKGGLSAVSRVNTSENLFEAWSKSEAMTDAASVCLSDSKHAAQGFPWDSPGEPAALPAGYTLPASFSQWQENPPASPGWFAASPGNGEDVSVLPKHSGKPPLLQTDASCNFNGISCYAQQPGVSPSIESLLTTSPLSSLSLPFQFMDFSKDSASASPEGADAEECRVRALLRELQQLQLHPTSLKPRDVVFRSSFTDGMRGELQYQVIEEGSFGKVFAGSLTRRPEQKVAIKVPVEAMLKVDPAGVMERFTNEWKILAACEHPGIVGLVGGVVHGPFDVWVVTNLVENGHDLHSRKYSRDPAIRREISPQAALSMCRQLASIVAYLHTPLPEAGKSVIVHRDIKPENVIVNDEWLIQLCDFGDAEASVDGRVSRVSGATWFYAPPELLQSSPVERAAGTFVSDPDTHGHGAGAAGQTGEPVFSEKWDIWSMGCVFHEMFGFQNPFHTYVSPTDPPESIYEKLKSRAQQNALVPAIDSRIQGLAREVITKCLNPNPEDRPSAEDVFRMWASADDLILKDVRLDVSGNLLHEREIPSSVSEHQVPSGAEAKAEVAAPDRGSNLTTPPDARYPASAPDFFRQLQPFSGGTEPGLAPDERRFGGDPAMESAQLIQGSRLSLAYGDALSAGTGLPMGSCGALSTDCKSRSAVGPESRARLIAAPVENLLSCGRQTVAAERWSLSCAPPPFHRGSSESHQQRLRDSAEPRNFGFEPAAPVGPEGHIQHTQGKRAPVDVVTPGVVGEEGPRAAMNVDSYATSCAGDQGYARWGVKTTGGQRPILGSGPGGARVRSVGVGGDGFVSVPNLAVVSAASGDFVC